MGKKKVTWRNVVEVPADGRSGMYGGAYTLAFVYSSKGNMLVKGYMREVEKYIDDNIKSQYFVNFTLYHMGQHRDIWKFWKSGVHIFEGNAFRHSNRPNSKHRKWEFRESSHTRSGEKKDVKEVKFKRLPNRWVSELEVF